MVAFGRAPVARQVVGVAAIVGALLGVSCSGAGSLIPNASPRNYAASDANANAKISVPINPGGTVLTIPSTGGYGGTIAIGSNTAQSGTTATVTSSLTPPPGPFNPIGRASSNPKELFYVQLSFSQFLVVFGGFPTFTITVPPTIPKPGEHFFLAIFDLAQPVPQQLGTLGPAVVNGNSLSFTSPTTPLVASTNDLFLATLYEDSTTPQVVREFVVTNPTTQQVPWDLARGNDRSMWVTINGGTRIDRLTPEGIVGHVSLPPGTLPGEITRGPDEQLWVAASNAIIKVSDDGKVSLFPIPTPGTSIGDIARCGRFSLCFTEFEAGKIGHISSSGQITEFTLTGQTNGPMGIAEGADDNVWFTLFNQFKVGRMTEAGIVSEFGIPYNRPTLITAGADGNIWIAEGDRIARVTPQGLVTPYAVRGTVFEGGSPLVSDLVTGKDGNVWFSDETNNAIGRITPSGIVSEYPLPDFGTLPFRVARGPNNTIWFTGLNGKVGILGGLGEPDQ